MLATRSSLSTVAGPAAAAGRIALLVMNAHSVPVLSPFFNKCEGVLLVDTIGRSTEFHPRDRTGVRSVRDLLVQLKPKYLICGYVGEEEKRALQACGIDVRLGSCNCTVDELATRVHTLPEA